MHPRGSKPRPYRSPVTLSKDLAEILWGRICDRTQRRLMCVDKRARDEAPDADSDADLQPAKKARQTVAESQQSVVVEEMTLHQPKPESFERSYVKFLGEFVDFPFPDPYNTSPGDFTSASCQQGRDDHSRSDSHLYYSDKGPISRQLTKSEPVKYDAEDADIFKGPLRLIAESLFSRPLFSKPLIYNTALISNTPPSSPHFSESSAHNQSNVCHPCYRTDIPNSHGIEFCYSRTKFPLHVSSRVEALMSAGRYSPDLSAEQMDAYLEELAKHDTNAYGVTALRNFFLDFLFPDPSRRNHWSHVGTEMSILAPIYTQLLPNDRWHSCRLSQPKPALLYGSSAWPDNTLLSRPQNHMRQDLQAAGTILEAKICGPIFPYLAVEFKTGYGDLGGLWSAANELAGASAACLNIVEQLNLLLEQYGVDSEQRVHNIAYGFTVNTNLAELYVSWKEGESKYYIKRIDVFPLDVPERFRDCRRIVRNIFDWARGPRLGKIKDVLDIAIKKRKRERSRHVGL
ncbi:hypothetical protein F5Y17DRAFT_473325 [Xylariaceae sp. FL0594]|nr:hypothetical protein F5Y17DRAFT_473325 [Xylariaceae sp. FL0594]